MLLSLRMLRVFEQFIKARALFRGEHLAEFFFGALKFFFKGRRHRLHEFAGVVLAFLQDFVDALTLFGGEIEVALHAAEELETHAAGGNGLG